MAAGATRFRTCFYPRDNMTIEEIYNDKLTPFGMALKLLKEYFNWNLEFVFCNPYSKLLKNGTWTGVIGMINRSEIDGTFQLIWRSPEASEAVQFLNSIKLFEFTFVTRKPEYKPEIFGIFKTISNSLWIQFALVVLGIILLYFLAMKHKFLFHKIILHVLAVLFRQPAIIRPSTVGEKILIYSWVFGAMLLCLFYDTVFLSFLAFSPTSGIKNISELAKAVEKGEYNCMVHSIAWAVPAELSLTKVKDFRTIFRHVRNNPNSMVNLDAYFRLKTRNTAFLTERSLIQFMKGRYFISEDRFFQIICDFAVQKNFPWVFKMNMAIRRLMEAGYFEKFEREQNFFYTLKYLSREIEPDKVRKLTITDVAPAFICLMIGLALSLVILVAEVLTSQGTVLQKWIAKRRKRLKAKCIALIHKFGKN